MSDVRRVEHESAHEAAADAAPGPEVNADAAAAPTPIGARAPAGHFPGLDAFRAIGMLMVVFAHAYYTTRNPNGHPTGIFGPFVARFDVALPMFLVLSAFLLFRPYFLKQLAGRPGTNPRRFYRHRFLRIFPGYWVALTVIVLVVGASFTGPRDALTFYGLLQTYGSGRVLAPQFQPIYQAWSLAAELLFYLLLPPFAFALRRSMGNWSAQRQLRGALACCAVVYLLGVTYRVALVVVRPSWVQKGVLWLPNWLDMFALGMALAAVSAWAAHTGRTPRVIGWLGDHPAVCWGVAAAIFVAITRVDVPLRPLQINGREYLLRQFSYGIFSVFFMLPAMFGDQHRGAIRAFLRVKPLVYLGTVSLGFYLYHLLFLHQAEVWTGRTFFNADFWTLIVVAVPLALAAASLSYFVVERPCLALKDRPLGGIVRRWTRAAASR